MAVRIRLSRFGRIHRPFFRVVAIDQRCHREGVASEILGTYDPLAPSDNFKLDATKVDAWLNRGASLSNSLGSLFKHHGIVLAARPKPTRIAKTKADTAALPKADGKKWVAPTRRAVKKHEAKLKAERKAKAAAAVPAAAEATPAAEAPKA